MFYSVWISTNSIIYSLHLSILLGLHDGHKRYTVCICQNTECKNLSNKQTKESFFFMIVIVILYCMLKETDISDISINTRSNAATRINLIKSVNAVNLVEKKSEMDDSEVTVQYCNESIQLMCCCAVNSM